MKQYFLRSRAALLLLLALVPGIGSAADSSGVADQNQAAASAFLQANRAKPGVVQTASGLQYLVISSGTGCHPKKNKSVTLNYEVKLLGSDDPLDSSYQRGKPDTFSLRQMIPAWQEGIPLMREGDIWQIFAPPNLAYGAKGSPPAVPPNSLLVFKVELIKAGTCAKE